MPGYVMVIQRRRVATIEGWSSVADATQKGSGLTYGIEMPG